jgi:AcrR family transcriptional regulator
MCTSRRVGREVGMSAGNDDVKLRKGDRTRLAILQAAREQFHRLGYDRTSIRSVAAGANIDPSMVMRYYGSKEGLFAAAVDVDLRLPDLSAAPRRQWGRLLVEHFLTRWEGDPADDILILLLRSAATNEGAAARMRAVFAEQLVTAIAVGNASSGDAERRAGLIATQMLGLAFCRYVLGLPGVADRPARDVVADVGPTVQRYLVAPLPA